MTHALVTGATGFVGFHLAKHLSDQGQRVTCLTRESSNRQWLQPLDVDFVTGDVTDSESVGRALADPSIDVVYHLAGLTNALSSKNLMAVNESGTRNVAAACATRNNPPILVSLSSLSAAGPAKNNEPLTEADTAKPVSWYGKSKRAGELAAIEYASQVPITIVRPPIVLGEADRVGLTMYQSIDNFGLHLNPCFADNHFSIIHASDLARACQLVAQQGTRLDIHSATSGDGIYFASADEIVSYAELGRMIGTALGRRRTQIIRFPSPMVWLVAGVNETYSQIRRHSTIVNWDKAREATAGSWICSSDRLRSQTEFAPHASLQDRLAQTVQWYREHGWLKASRTS